MAYRVSALAPGGVVLAGCTARRWGEREGRVMSRTKTSGKYRDEAVAELAKAFEVAPRDSLGRPVVWVNVTHVSKSGMSRRMRLYVVTPDRDVRDLTWLVARALDAMQPDDRGVRVDGCGMDMRWHLVDAVARVAGVGTGNDVTIQVL